MGTAPETTAQGDRRNHAEAFGTTPLDLGAPRRGHPRRRPRNPRRDAPRVEGETRAYSEPGHALAGGYRTGPDLEKKVERAAERDRPDVAAKRVEWEAKQPTLDPAKLKFIDETWASINIAPTHGRSPRGERLVGTVPHGHWKTTTFVAALGASGMTAPMVIDGAMNGDLFVAYVKQVLLPTLRPGDIVVMDNLSAHKRSEVCAVLEGLGCLLLYLPPYSPQGQRSLKHCSGKDFQKEVFVPATTAAFHDEAIATGMLL